MLPSHLLYVVGSYLSYDTCHNLRTANRYLSAIVNHEYFWKWRSRNLRVSHAAHFLAQHTSWKEVLDYHSNPDRIHLRADNYILCQDECLAWDIAGDLWILFTRGPPVKLRSRGVRVKSVIVARSCEKHDVVLLIFVSTTNELRALFIIAPEFEGAPVRSQNLLICASVRCASVNVMYNSIAVISTGNQLMLRIIPNLQHMISFLKRFANEDLPENFFLEGVRDSWLRKPGGVGIIKSVIMQTHDGHGAIYILSDMGTLYRYNGGWQMLQHNISSIHDHSSHQGLLTIGTDQALYKRLVLYIPFQEIPFYPNFVCNEIPFALVGDQVVPYLTYLTWLIK